MGSHGRFDAQARDHSWQLRWTLHRRAIAIGLLLALLAIVWLWAF